MFTMQINREEAVLIPTQTVVEERRALIDTIDAIFASNEIFGVALKDFQVANLKALRANAIADIEDYFV